jgi:uncharacterized protein YjdB
MTFRRQSLLVALAVVPSLLLAGCESSSAGLSSIVVTPSPVRLAVGGTSQLTVTGTYSDGTRAPLTSGVTFTSSAASVAAVSTSGVVTAIGSGTSTVTATVSGLTATTTVTVSSGPATLEAIAVLPPEVPLRIGGTSQLTVTGTYSDGSTVNVTSGSTFSSTSSGVATVSAGGLVTATGNGTATITATHTASGLVATAVVTVSASAPTLVSIAVVPATVPLLIGATGQLTVTGTYSDQSTVNLTAGSTFVSSNLGAATVSDTGLVTAVAGGSAIVTATHTASGKIASATVNVSATLAVAATRQLTVTGTYSDSTTADLTSASTFASSATGVATVSAGGLVTAVANGSATITATNTASGLTATSAITVSTTTATLVSIAITPTPVNLAVGGTQQLTVTGTYSDSSTANVTSGSTFVSSVEATATVSAGGLVTAVANGTTTITATHTASSLTATVGVTVAPPGTGGEVFVGAYSPGVAFVDFGGATNDVTIDSTEQRGGRDSLTFVVTGAGGYSGGAFVASAPRDLSSFNALTYWAKASISSALNVTGIGNDAAGGEGYSAESLAIPLTGTWTKYVIPIPAPSKFTAVTGLFHLAEGADGYTIWLNDIQYENLGASEVGAPTGATVNLPATQTVAVGSTYQIAYQPNTVSFDLPVLPNAGRLTNVGFLYFDLTSSDPTKATVSPLGLVTGVAAGSTNVTAALGSIAVAGQMAVTVTAPLAVPTTLAATPTHLPANVISMFNSSGTYTNVPVDTWNTSWSPQILSDYVIDTKTVMKYTGLDFVGIEFFNPGPVIAATGFTTFHVDIWTPNGAKFSVQLVNNVGPGQTVGQVDLDTTTTPAVSTGSWVGLDIPLASFTSAGLGGINALGQMLFLNQGVGSVPGAVFYIDNVYFWK